MERMPMVINLFIGFVLIGLCSGFPYGLENSAADYHTQFLTGLVGVLLTVCGVVLLVGCLCCQRNNGFKEFHNNPVVASSTTSLDHGHINPIANGEFTIFTPLSPPHHNNNVFLANEQIVGRTEIDYNHADIDVHSWFDGNENDFPRTKLKYIKELGKGWFGRVVEGTAQGLNDDDSQQSWTPVAVRILEASATSSERAVFLHDAVIYRTGKHPHILQLLGRSLESVPLLLLQELCPRGDLKKYLRDNQRTIEKLLSSDLPLLWCCQLSSALKHLHDHRLTHPDLATRNCQIVSDLNIKLGDYGLAASLYPEDYYQGAPAVPVRWCSPESLTYTSTTIQPKQTTFESNVWSLGVTMWEIYSCGAQPYAKLNDDDVISQVLGSANVRLSKPEVSVLCTDYIFRLMQLCWSSSELRPSVSQVHLMLTDVMQVFQNTKHVTSQPNPLMSMQDFDSRWINLKPNTVTRTDNHEFNNENMSIVDVDLSDITVINMNLNKEEELLNTKPMSPSLNNLHGSLDNLASAEMDSWLQKVATKTGDMSYVRGLSEAIKDLDNALALENVSSSDSSHQPSPAPENLPKVKSKLEFKLGPTTIAQPLYTTELSKTQNSSLTESMQRTSSESETEDENWRKKIERGAYSEKVQQKSKSVTDLMILTHIDCSESDSETPLPSLDYRVNYKNVRYAPKQNLENVSLMFGSEGNLLSVHDKFQEELKRLQEERKDSLLFVPESISHNTENINERNEDRIIRNEPKGGLDNFSSDEETWTVKKSEDVNCTYVNTNPTSSVEQQSGVNSSSKDASPSHRNPEALLEELSSTADIQPANQVYNIFNVTVDANFSPMHIRPDLKDIICYKDLKSEPCSLENSSAEVKQNDTAPESETKSFEVPKLSDIIQNNDDLMDYIITKYDTQEDNANISEINEANVTQEDRSPELMIEDIHKATETFLQNEQQNYEISKVHFDIGLTQEEILPNPMTHSAVFTSTPFKNSLLKTSDIELDVGCKENLQFSSNFSDLNEEETQSEMKYSLETWDNFLGTAMDTPRDCKGFDEFSSEPQSLLFVDNNILNIETVECKNEALIESLSLKNDLRLETNNVNIVDQQNVEQNTNNKTHSELNATVVVTNNLSESANVNQNDESGKNNEDSSAELDVNNATFTKQKDEQLDETYTKEPDDTNSGSNWEPGEGWFLHPQTNTEVSGQIEVSQGGEESYVGFSMDDEIMAAIRNELLMKLPQAQGQSSEQIKDSDEWDTEGRSEVLIKYNVYATPLSPIPEESYSENDSYHFIYNRENSSDSENDDDWPEPYEEPNSAMADTETRSIQNAGSPIQEPQNRHTPSQDSCCSNDTLFNLEDLTYVLTENENAKTNNDLVEKKSDVIENNKDVTIDLSNCKEYTEEPTLKIEDCIDTNSKNIEQQNIMLELQNKKNAKEDVQCNNKESNKCTLKAEIFTCNFEPTVMSSDEKEQLENIEDDDNIDNKMLIENCKSTDFINHTDFVNKGNEIIEKNKINFEKTFELKYEECSNKDNLEDYEKFKNNIDEMRNADKHITNLESFEIYEDNEDGIYTNMHNDQEIIEDKDLLNSNEDNISNKINLNFMEDKVNDDITINNLDQNNIEEDKIDILLQNESRSKEVADTQEENKKPNASQYNFHTLQRFIDNEIINENKIRIDSVLINLNEIKPSILEESIDIEEEQQEPIPTELLVQLNEYNDNLVKHTEEMTNETKTAESLADINFKFVEETKTIKDDKSHQEETKQNLIESTGYLSSNEEKTEEHTDLCHTESEAIIKIDNNYETNESDVHPNLVVNLIQIEANTKVNNRIDSTLTKEGFENLADSKDFENSTISNIVDLNSIDPVKPLYSKISEIDNDQNEDPESKTNFHRKQKDNIVQENNIHDDVEAELDDIISQRNNSDDTLPNHQEDLGKFSVTSDKSDSINKLNIKNIQNGKIPGHSPKCIEEDDLKSSTNENDVNLINVLEKSDNNQTKIINKTVNGENESSTDYLTEFLNNERQNSISSLGSSKDEDSSSSLHNSKSFTTENDYVNVDDIKVEFAKDSLSSDLPSYVDKNFNTQPDYVNVMHEDEEHLYDPVAGDCADVDIYDALTDIRFSGPSDVQLMSTSFSESAEIDEQDWDSGSETRSSSSGEFIWKEGEYEESVKALRAAPQDVMATENVAPMEEIEEMTSESSDDEDEEDPDSPEFIPSAWDKYATPTKSALRSPEKTLEKSEIKQHKKSKGVWFKKQKYHCVYEYPREPESPNVNSYELWQPVSTSLIDWEIDTTNPYVTNFDATDSHPDCYQHLDNHPRNMYQLNDFTSGMTALDDEFFISSTAKPFESFGTLSSQFFPGQTTSDQWVDLTRQPNDNITPDSGVEDITPASNVDGNDFPQPSPKQQVQPLKLLAASALKHTQINELKSSNKDALGGLRHARNKLKLDLPPSPSAFTSTKAFTIEPPEEPVLKREVPTFTTFGKSRFLVQHVDTPTPDEQDNSKNVSFEALPYKPLQIIGDSSNKGKVEIVRGEASLLDSADEDSGIESSTLERKRITN